MNIENISLVVNGMEVGLKNASQEQVLSILNALSGNSNQAEPTQSPRPIRKERLDHSYRDNNPGNYQYESSATSIDYGFDRELALSLPVVHLSIDTGLGLKKNSKQVAARKAVITTFIASHNTPMTIDGVIDRLKSISPNITPGAASTYSHHCRKLGILAKNKANNTFHLSKWFLDQVK